MEPPSPTSVAAYGQTWHFTARARAALKPFGMGTPATLKNLIIVLSPPHGLPENATYSVNYQGVDLTVSTLETQVMVDAGNKV